MEKIVIIGKHGRVGGALCNYFEKKGKIVCAYSRDELDIASTLAIRAFLKDKDFDALFCCAAMTSVDACEKEPDLSKRVNSLAPQTLAEICREKNAKMVHISTDYVLDGEKSGLKGEDYPTRPQGVYAKSKLDGEQKVMQANPDALVARVSWVFGNGKPSFVDSIIEQAMTQKSIKLIADKFSCPSYTADIATCLDQVASKCSGLIHLCNKGECSWLEFGKQSIAIARELGVKLKLEKIKAVSMADIEFFTAKRPKHTGMSTKLFEKISGEKIRHWHEAMREYIEEKFL